MKNPSKFKASLRNALFTAIIPVGAWLIFAILSGGRTATVSMLITTVRQAVIGSIICYGLMLNMTVGMMNFSAGGMMLFAAIIGGNLAKMTGTGAVGLVLFCVGLCVLEGALTGVLYNAMRVPCIVLTIGMMLIWEAAPKAIFSSGVNLKASMTFLSTSPYCFIILAIMGVLFYFIYNKTPFGHNLRAIGNNQAIANSVGLNGDKIKFLSFLLGSIFLGVASVIYVSNAGELRNVTSMSSMTIMMDGFMGMFIAMFMAKWCNMSIAVVLGCFTMKMITNGFVAMGMSATVRDIVQGLFLLILLVISANAGFFERRKSNKAFKEKCDAAYQAQNQIA